MAGGPTALTLIARTSATGAQPLSLRARFSPTPPPLKKIPLPAPA
ncbi:YkgJ family cysteine cluster protein, partial [Pseudomonas aeruginosa]